MGLRLLLAAATLLTPLSSTPAQQPAMRTVESVDLKRYAGTWYEIARLPNSFQDHCAGDVTALYSLRQDGRIDVVNRCRTSSGEMSEARGIARLATKDGRNTKLKVRFAPAVLSFLPMVWGDYWILGLAPDYHWAVVGEPSRKYLWILARTPDLPASTLEQAREIAKINGYDLGALQMTAQPAVRTSRKPEAGN
jgi:apolipoprotein D and lipocalin family protein